MSVALANLFPNWAPVDAAAPADARMKWDNIPAKGAVYLLVAADDQPLLLSTVGNLRAALQRRMSDALIPEGENPTSGGRAPTPTKRISYGTITQRVGWIDVHSSLSANWHYWNAARLLFPSDYRERLTCRPAWWIGIELPSPFPRLIKTQTPTDPAMRYVGPVRDRTAATTLIETVEDLFDLCREYPILVQAPFGKACAYKEMGKCPAPCDGSIAMERYHEQLHAAWGFLTGETRGQWLEEQNRLMRSAAVDLRFEVAGRIKARLARSTVIGTPPYIWMAPLEEFAFLTLPRGEGRTRIEPWMILPGGMQVMPSVQKKTLAADAAALFASLEKIDRTPRAFDSDQSAIAIHHLFREKEEAETGPKFFRLSSILALGTANLRCLLEERLTQKAEPEAIISAQSHEETTSSPLPAEPAPINAAIQQK